jgi:magnesium-transporting ATPase (P-type)/uncharacterized membrane protein
VTPLLEFARLHWVWGLDALGLALLVGYQLYASGVFRRHPECTHRGRSNRLRRAWVESVRADGKDMLAIATLRNWVMSTTMFASTCILIGLGIMGLTFGGLDLADLSQALSWVPSQADAVRVKLLLLAAVFFSGFMLFLLALRYYNQGGFVINLPDGFFSGPPAQPIADTLDRAGGYYNSGTRVFILALPFVLWLIGPDWFLGGVSIALLLLYRFDFHDERAPRRAPAVPLAGLGVGAPHALPVAEVFAALHSGPAGLATAEAAKRLAAVGPNRLQAAPKTGPILRFFKHFNDSLIYILLAGALVTALLGQWVDTGVILAVTLINAVIGFIQEGKAEQALAGIRTMLALRTHCRRDGQWVRLDAADLVPGDTVRLVAGDRVPADLRLSEAASLRIDESALTGESIPADKGTDPVDQSAGIGDRGGVAYAGTLVAGGSGLGVVTGTGARTELGRIGQLIAQVQTLDTPLTRQMAAFGRVLALVIVAMAAGMFLIGWQLHEFPLGDLAMAAIAFAVAAIPEGLPAILTITLALGVQRMAQRNAITRRLPAVETLGSVTVICTDKTGTLTRNEMTVRHVVTRVRQYQVSGIGYAPDGLVRHAGQTITLAETPDLLALIEVAALCNDAGIAEDDGHWKVIGEPTEGALCTLARKAGFTPGKARRLAVIPFDSTAKIMATLHQIPRTGLRLLVKGAPGPVLERCTSQRAADGRDEPLDTAYWVGQVDALGAQGLRVLAAAAGTPPDGKTDLSPADLDGGLVFLGLVGIVDPPRPEAVAAIAAFRQAGIRVKMITGDHPGTAIAIGREMGIGDGSRAVTGAELEAADDAALRQIVQNYDVFARTSPEHKLRLVQALQANGEVVAMTGDGVNDAPALKRADVGVAMGIKGTEATKEAAAIVLADDNFASIEHAVEQGRTIYDNLRKSIVFLLPTNGAQALVILVAVLFGLALPLAPVQILWVNMVVAVTLSLALAFEPAETGLMQRPPRRPDAPILGARLLWRIALVSLLIGGATIAVFLFERGQGLAMASAQTMAVTTLVLAQAGFLFNCRSLTESSLRPRLWFTNPAVWLSVGLLIVLQGLFVYVPVMNLWFHTAPLAAREWLLPIGVGLAIFLLVEVEKALARWLAPSPPPTARFITRLPGNGTGEASSRHELNYLKASHP